MNPEHISKITNLQHRVGVYKLVVAVSQITANSCAGDYANNPEAVIHRDNMSLQQSVRVMHTSQQERVHTDDLVDEDHKFIAEMLSWYGAYKLAQAILSIEVEANRAQAESDKNEGFTDIFLLGSTVMNMKSNHFLRIMTD